MATSTEQAVPASKFAAVLKGASNPEGPPKKKRRRGIPRWVLYTGVVATILGLGAATFSSSLLTPSKATTGMLTERIKLDDLVVSVTEDGNLESAHNKDVKCEVQGGATILWLIKDGTEVEAGEELVRLDSSTIEDKMSQQKIVFEKARAAMIEAEKNYKSAEISVREYAEGTFKQQLQDLEAKKTVAKENLESARNSLQFANQMARKGYINTLQRDAQAFAVQRSTLDLQVAETAITVLENFTKPKQMVTLEAAADTAKAKMASEEASFNLEKERLERFEEQLGKCVIKAPDDGMVIYANESQNFGRGGSSQQSLVEEGALMRERQSILRLPDLSRMQVKSTVHESKVDSLAPGMRARIRVQDHEYQGYVTTVASQAEPSNFFSGSVKEYATIVTIDNDSHNLRPGMTCAVEILVANLKNVLSVPVQAVVEKGNNFYCWVETPSGPEKRKVLLGMSNNTRIEIKDGLKKDDLVLLNPRAMVDEAREDERTEERVDVKSRFGGDTRAELPKAAGPPGGKKGDSKGRGGMNLMEFDKDGDKKVSKDEAPEQVQKFFDMIDTNKDGFIDAKEIAAAEARRRAMQQSGGAGGPGGPGGAPGGGGPAGGGGGRSSGP